MDKLYRILKLLILLLLIAVIVVGILVAVGRPTQEEVETTMAATELKQDLAPDFTMYDIDGKAVKTAIVCDIADAGFYADFNKFEIKTFRIDAEGYVTETDYLEGVVEY